MLLLLLLLPLPLDVHAFETPCNTCVYMKMTEKWSPIHTAPMPILYTPDFRCFFFSLCLGVCMCVRVSVYKYKRMYCGRVFVIWLGCVSCILCSECVPIAHLFSRWFVHSYANSHCKSRQFKQIRIEKRKKKLFKLTRLSVYRVCIAFGWQNWVYTWY